MQVVAKYFETGVKRVYTEEWDCVLSLCWWHLLPPILLIFFLSLFLSRLILRSSLSYQSSTAFIVITVGREKAEFTIKGDADDECLNSLSCLPSVIYICEYRHFNLETRYIKFHLALSYRLAHIPI